MGRSVSPTYLARHRKSSVVDIRASEERLTLGWIPGSLWLPDPQTSTWVDRLPAGPVTLVCNSGRRTRALVEALDSAHIDDVKGGLLAWRAARLPITELRETDPSPLSRERFEREAMACFVGSSMLTNTMDPSLAAATLEDIMAEMDGSPEQASRAVEKLSVMAWRAGVPLKVIARNTSHFYALSLRLRPDLVA